MDITITRMTEDDLPEVMALERGTFTAPWSKRMFRDEMEREFSHILLARGEDGALVGFICFWVLLDEMHLLNIAVDEKYRRKGVGTRLAHEALAFARGQGAASATLEVREKNRAAIEFYGGLGFIRSGLRRGYYDSPPDNAVIMWLYDIAGKTAKTP